MRQQRIQIITQIQQTVEERFERFVRVWFEIMPKAPSEQLIM